MPQAASTHLLGVNLHILYTGDLNPLQSVQRDSELQPKTIKDSESYTMGLLQVDVRPFFSRHSSSDPTERHCLPSSHSWLETNYAKQVLSE